MATREWTELEEINGKAYLVKHSEVDVHEDYISHSFHILRVASPEDIKDYQEKESTSFER